MLTLFIYLSNSYTFYLPQNSPHYYSLCEVHRMIGIYDEINVAINSSKFKLNYTQHFPLNPQDFMNCYRDLSIRYNNMYNLMSIIYPLNMDSSLEYNISQVDPDLFIVGDDEENEYLYYKNVSLFQASLNLWENMLMGICNHMSYLNFNIDTLSDIKNNCRNEIILKNNNQLNITILIFTIIIFILLFSIILIIFYLFRRRK